MHCTREMFACRGQSIAMDGGPAMSRNDVMKLGMCSSYAVAGGANAGQCLRDMWSSGLLPPLGEGLLGWRPLSGTSLISNFPVLRFG